ncbi:Ribokinase-like protein [Mycena rosella]|uniref:Ribokinase n=1 Tax=Mycena rosella TaxID=1033263 RepID=A0AAD7GUU7_MYCRO|nr:Ribokinase-like protein [Mycena rosella]
MPARCLVRGSINIDEFFQVKDIVRPGETVSSDHLVKRPGGKGANQAVAVARAGAIVDLVGAVGRDGLWVRDELKEAGVGVESVSIAEENIGRAIIQVTELGENSIILFKGANYATLPAHAIHPDTTHIALQNEIPLPHTIDYLARASSSSSKISTIFNPSPMPTAAELKALPWHQLTWLIVNSGEALNLCTALNLEVPPMSASASASVVDTATPLLLRLAAYMPTTNVVCTLGADGVLAKFILPGASEAVYLPAAKLQGTTRDTTGAGDCFTGYMVAGLMRLDAQKKATVEEYTSVLRRCAQAAGMCVEKRGALASIPFGEDVDARLS